MARLCKIKASAGSGKTHTLTRRYLDLILRSHSAPAAGSACAFDWYSLPPAVGDILAITFTNAAVAEMRERVLQDLKKAALGKITIDKLDAAEARVCLENLLLNMGAMNIRTIDSLLHQITRSAALNLGLSPDFQPTFDAKDAFVPYLQKFLRSAESGDEAANKLLEEVVSRALKHEENRGDKALKSFLPPQTLIKRMEPYLSDVLLEKSADLACAAEVEEILNRQKAVTADCAARMSDLLAGLLASEDGSSLKINGSKKVDQKLERIKKQDFSIDSTFNMPDAATDIFTRSSLKNREELVDALESPLQDLKDSLTALKQIMKPCQDYLKNAPVIELVKQLSHEFNKDLPNGVRIPSTMIAHYARKALDCDNGICEALCRMGNRLTHFLVDEFQDTSRDQWAGFRMFVEDALSRGGSLTWVGDVKQSIYTWRNAAPELFDEIQTDEVLRNIEPETDNITLPMNRRSGKVIVDFNNALFAGLADVEYARTILATILKNGENAIELAAPRVVTAYYGCRQEIPKNSQTGGYVKIEKIGANDDEFLNDFPLRLVEALKNEIRPGHSWSDIMILVRSGKEASSLAATLVGEKIPVVTENSLMLAGHPLIEQILAFLAFLDNPGNEPAFLTLIGGSIFNGVEGMDVLPGLADLALLKKEKNLFVYFREAYPEIWEEYLKPFYIQSTLLTAYDATREWYRRMDVESRFSEETLFLRSFLEVLQKAEADGVVSISGFLKFWTEKGGETKAHTPENIDAVHIMTIHKSKGLQAPIVIVPLPGSSMSLKTSKWDTCIIKKFGDVLLQVPFLKQYEPEYSQSLATEALEALNLLYVAFTRARNELYIFTPERDDTLLGVLLNMAEIDGDLPLGTKSPSSTNISETGSLLPRDEPPFNDTATLPMEWLPKLKIAHSQLSTRKFTAAERGTFLHFCLENIQFGENADIAAQNAMQYGLSHGGIDVPEDEETRASLLASLAWCATCPEMWLWNKNGWPEQPVMDDRGNELRVDLLVQQPWGVLVVDYKSGKPSESHVEQIQNYLKCVDAGGQFPGIARGLLVYLDERLFRLVSKDRAGEFTGECPRFSEDNL